MCLILVLWVMILFGVLLILVSMISRMLWLRLGFFLIFVVSCMLVMLGMFWLSRIMLKYLCRCVLVCNWVSVFLLDDIVLMFRF